MVGINFDPMLAKVIAHGPNRTEASSRLALALERTHLAGMRTNRDFLVNVLRTPEFLEGDTTTDFIDRVDPPRSLEFVCGDLLSPEFAEDVRKADNTCGQTSRDLAAAHSYSSFFVAAQVT